jgi:hypothetical protein
MSITVREPLWPNDRTTSSRQDTAAASATPTDTASRVASQAREAVTGVTFSIARTADERLAASRLVYEQYVTTGLICPNPYKVHLVPAHLSDETTVIIGEHQGRVVCSVSLIGDNGDGLPMEEIYPHEIQQRRDAGLVMAEVSCLAISEATARNFLPTLIGMTRLMAQHARHRDIDQLVIAAHPKHARFYERFMGFQRFGILRRYPRFRDHPAVASCLDFDTIDRNRPRCWDDYFRLPIPEHELRCRRLSPTERDQYLQLLDLIQFQQKHREQPIV